MSRTRDRAVALTGVGIALVAAWLLFSEEPSGEPGGTARVAPFGRFGAGRMWPSGLGMWPSERLRWRWAFHRHHRKPLPRPAPLPERSPRGTVASLPVQH